MIKIDKLPHTGRHRRLYERLNAMIDAIRANRIMPSKTIRVKRTSTGVVLDAVAGTGGGGGGPAVWS